MERMKKQKCPSRTGQEGRPSAARSAMEGKKQKKVIRQRMGSGGLVLADGHHERPGLVVPNSVKRGAFERMIKIYGLLQDEKYPNCTSVGRDFEVSLKTA